MSDLTRFSVSLPGDLIALFDEKIAAENYPTRSMAIGDLIRENLVQQEWSKGSLVAGAIILVYDHHKRELAHTLMHIQHDFHDIIISSQHVHLDHDNCLEIVVTRGEPGRVQILAKQLKTVKGVIFSTLAMATTGLFS